MSRKHRLRVRVVLADHGLAVVAVLLLFGLAAGGAAGLAYAHHDDTTTVTERTHVRTVGLNATDSAVVTGDTDLWARGTRLTDHPAYLRNASPTLTVTAVTSVPRDRPVDVRQRFVLALNATTGDGTFWRDRSTLAAREGTVRNGRFEGRASLDVSRVAARIDRARERVGGAATLTARLRVETRYDTGRYEGTLTTTAPLTVDGETYAVGTFESADRTHAETVTRRVERSGPHPSKTTLVGGAVGLLALLGAGAALVETRRDADPQRLRRRLERARFDEWISAGSVAPDAADTTVEMASLTDLVDVAIDSNRRVIHDERRGVYVVLDGATAHEYRPADATRFEWSDAGAAGSDDAGAAGSDDATADDGGG